MNEMFEYKHRVREDDDKVYTRMITTQPLSQGTQNSPGEILIILRIESS